MSLDCIAQTPTLQLWSQAYGQNDVYDDQAVYCSSQTLLRAIVLPNGALHWEKEFPVEILIPILYLNLL